MHRREFFQTGTSQKAVPPSLMEDSPVAELAASRATRSRRGFLQIVSGVVLSNLTGCAAWKIGRQAKCELSPDIPMTDLVAHLNSSTDQINSWWSPNVKIRLEGASMIIPPLAADMAIERPRNFRLRAKVLNSDMVDLGSNEERFWFWGKEENMVLTARHDQMAAAQRQLPLPFEPDWLIEALGVIPLDENEIEFEKHPTDPKRVFFKRQRTTPDGAQVELISTVDTCLGVIREHSLVNRNGKIIALAKLGEHEREGESKIKLAHTVELSWPQAQLGLHLRIGGIILNPKSLPRELFDMPDMKCQVVDIGGEGGAVREAMNQEPQPRSSKRGKARL